MRLLALLLIAVACGSSEAPVHSKTFYSEVYTVDQVYRSMKGPRGHRFFTFMKSEKPELLWITAYHTEIVAVEGGSAMSPEFMCHSNLDLVDVSQHDSLVRARTDRARTTRLFTLSQGQMAVRFPPGFGIPVLSNEKLRLGTQVLNLNAQEQTFRVQHKTTIEFVRDADLRTPLKPLYQQGLNGLVLISGRDGYYGIDAANPEEHGQGCAIGETAGDIKWADEQGRVFAAHWVVEPGLHEYRTLVTEMLGLSFDTTAHHIAVHLHPFARSLELRDVTTDTTVFISAATNSTGQIGLEQVESFSSAEGLQLYKDHQYELVSVYNNTSGEPQDAMAVMLVYLLDPIFKNPVVGL